MNNNQCPLNKYFNLTKQFVNNKISKTNYIIKLEVLMEDYPDFKMQNNGEKKVQSFIKDIHW